jgi:hemerythrin superfamily protein
MDLSEFLMMEHADIRILINTGFLNNVDNFKAFNDFLVVDHISIEEKVYFPVILDNDWEDKSEFSKLVERVINDHKLLETLYKNMMARDNLFGLRLPLFYKTLQEHNNFEEANIFSRWKFIDINIRQNALDNAISIVNSLDDKYLVFSGFSKKFKEYIENKSTL